MLFLALMCNQSWVFMAVVECADLYGRCWQIRWQQRRGGNDS